MEGISFDNMLGEQEIDNLFMEPDETTTEEQEVASSEEEAGKKENSETNSLAKN